MAIECIVPGCDIFPCFNFPGMSGHYCRHHSKEGMIDVRNKKCLEEGCNIRCFFNYPGNLTGVYCCRHAKEGMINVRAKKCNVEGCITAPSFNFAGKKCGLRCKKHALPDMINVTHHRDKIRKINEMEKLKKEKINRAKNALRFFERSLGNGKEMLDISEKETRKI